MNTTTEMWNAIMTGAIIGLTTSCIVIVIAEAIYIYKNKRRKYAKRK